jgi:quinol monooxygenase YgiN
MVSPPVRMIVRWSVPAGESRPIASALQELMLSTREEPGCVGCSLSTEMSAHVSVFYVEEWASEADLQRQLRSHRFALLAELMERASQSPTVEFVLPHSIRGLDYASEVRGDD